MECGFSHLSEGLRAVGQAACDGNRHFSLEPRTLDSTACTYDCVIPGGGVTQLQEKDKNAEHCLCDRARLHLSPSPSLKPSHTFLPFSLLPHFLWPQGLGTLIPSASQFSRPRPFRAQPRGHCGLRLDQHLLSAFREPQTSPPQCPIAHLSSVTL